MFKKLPTRKVSELDLFLYEIWMFNQIQTELSVPDTSQAVLNACLESFLIHARNLIRFLEGDTNSRDNKDDLTCARFTTANGIKMVKIPVMLPQKLKEKINKHLSHLTVISTEEKDTESLKEELGDLLFQVVFHAQIAKERGEFTLEDVLSELTSKMVRRHPHVFSHAKVGTAREALARWEELKNKERKNQQRKSILDGIPKQLPALIRANQLQSRAARVGFDWFEFGSVWAKVREELKETEDAIEKRDPEGIEA